jgi:hypothetical protein
LPATLAEPVSVRYHIRCYTPDERRINPDTSGRATRLDQRGRVYRLNWIEGAEPSDSTEDERPGRAFDTGAVTDTGSLRRDVTRLLWCVNVELGFGADSDAVELPPDV